MLLTEVPSTRVASVGEIIAGILTARGIPAAEHEAFLNPSISNIVAPETLPGIVESADAILAAVSAGRKIVVFGDYDCDGVCATAILVKTLTALGASVEAFLPRRLDEGYGMSEASISRLLSEFPDVGLVITVDNGVNSVEQIATLKAKGISVVVTDHHLSGEILPEADAIVDPKVAREGVTIPESVRDLCGAGVAYLLARRLVDEARCRGMYSGQNIGGPLLVLAGLATVTDIMPLVGQNRILVAEALKHFRNWAPIGLRELHDRAARTGVMRLTSKDFGFLIGPRINAAGRMELATSALELILTEDREIAREGARIVDGYNVDRKNCEQSMTDEAMSKVVQGAAAQVIDLPNGHPGVAGIVAARVLERLSNDPANGPCPVCVIAGGHGSARAPDGLNIRDAMASCREVLTAFGGHAAAGGFSVKEGCVDAFRQQLCDYCLKLGWNAPVVHPSERVDAWIAMEQVTVELCEAAERFEPCGEGNPEPVFGIRDAAFLEVKPLGQEGRHLQVTLRRSGLRAVWWNRGDLAEKLREEVSYPHDITFTVIASDYGERHAELRLTSISEPKCA